METEESARPDCGFECVTTVLGFSLWFLVLCGIAVLIMVVMTDEEEQAIHFFSHMIIKHAFADIIMMCCAFKTLLIPVRGILFAQYAGGGGYLHLFTQDKLVLYLAVQDTTHVGIADRSVPRATLQDTTDRLRPITQL